MRRLELPVGTVSFLFTDIEGSTSLLQEIGTAFRDTLERHNEIVRGAVLDHRGHVVTNEGDGFFAVFQSAVDAVTCAVAIHRLLSAEQWAGPRPVRVRVGVHTGEARPGGADYVGIDVHRAARIGACGHGGQTVVSEVTARLTEHSLPPGSHFEDLGTHRLKDLAHEEHLYQLTVDDLPSEFPAIRTMSTVKGNLPHNPLVFIGRRRERDQLASALATSRLVTLTGPGGVGKTSLALNVAGDLFNSFPDGIWLIEVSRLADETLLAASIARQLHITEALDQALLDTLTSRLSRAKTLLILDGCEHLIEAVAKLTDHLLHWTTELQVLVTSREWLSIRGEHLVQLEPLAVPGPGARNVEDIGAHDAVTLFVTRANLVQPALELDMENAHLIAEICRRLDGIPLAIELAAARLKVLSVAQLVERLDRQFALLASMSRDTPPHQQTLETTLDWSYDFLTDPEKTLFTRLSVFSGGFTLDAVEAVCSGGPVVTEHVLDLLGRLVETSLVMTADRDMVRYRLLEPISHYARMRLVDREDIGELQERHARFYAEIAETADRHLLDAEQTTWIDRVDRERYNLRTAIQWFYDNGLTEETLRLAGALRWFWVIRREVSEGSEWLERALAMRSEASQEVVARVLSGAGLLALMRLEFDRSEVALLEARGIYEELGDAKGAARQDYHLANIPWLRDDLETAIRRSAEAEASTHASGDRWGEGWTLAVRGTIARCSGDLATAEHYLERSHRVLTALGGTLDIGWSLLRLGALARDQGEYRLAAERYSSGRELLAKAGDALGLAHADAGLGALAWLAGEHERALALYRGVLEGFSLSEEAANNLFELKTMIQGNPSTETLMQIVEMNRDRARLVEGLVGAKAALAEYLYHMGKTAHRNDETARAGVALVESLRLCVEADDLRGAAIAIAALAVITAAEGGPERAARLFGLASHIAESDRLVDWPPPDEPGYDEWRQSTKSSLGAARFEEEAALGASYALADAVDLAVGPA
jgi:predicted ATPase/class 3 adenylate cyclase